MVPLSALLTATSCSNAWLLVLDEKKLRCCGSPKLNLITEGRLEGVNMVERGVRGVAQTGGVRTVQGYALNDEVGPENAIDDSRALVNVSRRAMSNKPSYNDAVGQIGLVVFIGCS